MKREYIRTKIWLDDDQHVEVDGFVHYSIDSNYGADADGNRGYLRVEVEDVTDVQAYDENGDEVELSANGLQEAKEALERAFLEQGA